MNYVTICIQIDDVIVEYRGYICNHTAVAPELH